MTRHRAGVRGRDGAAAALALVILVAAGCSGEPGDASVTAARTQVTVKETAVETARADAAAADADFCSAATRRPGAPRRRNQPPIHPRHRRRRR